MGSEQLSRGLRLDMPSKPASKPTSKTSKRAVSVDSTSSQERMITESLTHDLTGENGENAVDNEENGSQNEGGEDEEDEDEVYEIEKILHHSKNMFVSVDLVWV